MGDEGFFFVPEMSEKCCRSARHNITIIVSKVGDQVTNGRPGVSRDGNLTLLVSGRQSFPFLFDEIVTEVAKATTWNLL